PEACELHWRLVTLRRRLAAGRVDAARPLEGSATCPPECDGIRAMAARTTNHVAVVAVTENAIRPASMAMTECRSDRSGDDGRVFGERQCLTNENTLDDQDGTKQHGATHFNLLVCANSHCGNYDANGILRGAFLQ